MNPEEIIHAFDNGERDLEPMLEKMGWKSWLGVAELGLVMQSPIVDFLEEELTASLFAYKSRKEPCCSSIG